ncbi:MAG: hypothetical protein WCK31_01050, partial [bacterium]
MYNLPPKIVLVSATSGVSDVYFLDTSFDNIQYLKQIDSKIMNSSLSIVERYFPQKSQVVVVTDIDDTNNYLSASKNIECCHIDTPNENCSAELLTELESDDLLYLDINFENIKINRIIKSDKSKKVLLKTYSENYSSRLSYLIQNADDLLLKNIFFKECLNDFENSKEYFLKYKKSAYFISTLLKNIFTESKVEKELDIKTFGKSNRTNPVVIIGGDAVKFFGVD